MYYLEDFAKLMKAQNEQDIYLAVPNVAFKAALTKELISAHGFDSNKAAKTSSLMPIQIDSFDKEDPTWQSIIKETGMFIQKFNNSCSYENMGLPSSAADEFFYGNLKEFIIQAQGLELSPYNTSRKNKP